MGIKFLAIGILAVLLDAGPPGCGGGSRHYEPPEDAAVPCRDDAGRPCDSDTGKDSATNPK